MVHASFTDGRIVQQVLFDRFVLGLDEHELDEDPAFVLVDLDLAWSGALDVWILNRDLVSCLLLEEERIALGKVFESESELFDDG